MSASKLIAAAALLLAASPAMAKTDIAGCVSSDTVINSGSGPYFSRIWYVPGTGEVCEFLDCGGGRAPPKTNVPGCPGYKGTETYSPSYLDLKTSAASEPTITSEAAAETTTEGGKKASYEATLTEAPKTDKAKTTLSTAVAESESAAHYSNSNGTVTSAPVYSTPASGSSGSGSGSGSDSTATPAASTAGAASMTAGGALVALMAGAAVFAML